MRCVLEAHLQPLAGAVVRITDRQGYQASERWTDSLQDQARLEALIDTVKPPAPQGQHRLLTTPFRYPPLRSGSRFTAADQRELFDGARGLGTVLAERAASRLSSVRGIAVVLLDVLDSATPTARHGAKRSTRAMAFNPCHPTQPGCLPLNAIRKLMADL